MLELCDVACRRGDFRLEVPALSLRPGEAVAVTGPSGCGKSTLLDLIGLVLRPASTGRFVLHGADMAHLWAEGHSGRLAAMRAAGIGYVLQTGGLLPFLSVRDNLRLSPRLLGQAPDAATERRLVDLLGLDGLLHRMPSALSVGERQRVAIARALAHRPPLVLADEPTASLDPVQAQAVMGLLLALVGELGTGLIVVSHDWDLLERFALRRVEAHVAAGPVTRFEGRAP